jgi:hypothetical protein
MTVAQGKMTRGRKKEGPWRTLCSWMFRVYVRET